LHNQGLLWDEGPCSTSLSEPATKKENRCGGNGGRSGFVTLWRQFYAGQNKKIINKKTKNIKK